MKSPASEDLSGPRVYVLHSYVIRCSTCVSMLCICTTLQIPLYFMSCVLSKTLTYSLKCLGFFYRIIPSEAWAEMYYSLCENNQSVSVSV